MAVSSKGGAGQLWQTLRQHRIPTCIILVAFLALRIQHWAPILYSDDWAAIARPAIQGTLQFFEPTNRRPLLEAPFLIIDSVFGLDLAAYYSVQMVLNILSAAGLYLLLFHLVPEWPDLALASAAVFLVHPADYTSNWLIMLGIRLSLCVTILGALLHLRFARNGRKWYLAGSLLAFAISLVMYEAELGLIVGWTLLCLLLEWRSSRWLQRALILTPLVVVGLYSFWRTIGQQWTGVNDNYLSLMVLAPSVLVTRIWDGLQILFGAGWIEPLRSGLDLSAHQDAWGILLTAMCVSIITLADMEQGAQRCPPRDIARVDRKHAAKKVLGVLLLGLMFSLAGYVPVLAVFGPALSGVASRVNLQASLGASVVVATVPLFAGLVLTRDLRRLQRYALVGSIPFFVLGLSVQARVQRDSKAAWLEQEQVWNELFALAPDLEGGTSVYLLMPGYVERFGLFSWERTPLSRSWEVSAGLQVLYDEPTLRGTVFLTDILWYRRPTVEKDGVRDPVTNQIVPFDTVLFLNYSGEPRRLSVVESLDGALGTGWDPPTYRPHDRILYGEHPPVRWRELVAIDD